MKKSFCVVAVLVMLSVCTAALWAQSVPEFYSSAGSWSFNARDFRLYQNDAKETLAKANFRVPQSGNMLYEFNVRYEGTLDDTHAGLGIHLFVDNAVNTRSWGSGSSYLFWLNYDESPVSKTIPAGLSAQVYYSRSQSVMTLVDSIDLNEYVDALDASTLYAKTPVRITFNGNTGELRIYDPFDPNMEYYYAYTVDPALIRKNAAWVSLRTNSMPASFALGLN